MSHKSRENNKNCMSLSENCNFHLKTPNGCVIILEKLGRGGKINLFVHTETDSVDTRGLFDFLIKNQSTSSSYENEGIFKRQGSKNAMANVLGAANYLAQLFIKCDGKYGCTKTKIEKLLSIANLIYMKKGELLFDENICIRDCGVGIRFNFPAHLCGNVVLPSSSVVEGVPISPSDINENITFSSQFNIDVHLLNDNDKDALRSVFLRFGNYESQTLGDKINEFKANLSRTGAIGEPVLVDRCIQFFSCDDDNNNEIIRYILEK